MTGTVLVKGSVDQTGGSGKPMLKLNTDGSISTVQLPASLGIKTAAASLSVAPASDAVFVAQGSTLTNAATAAYAASLVIKGSTGKLRRLNGYNSLGSAQWIQLHDAAALPADTAVPVAILYVGANQNFSFDYGLDGRSFATGIVVCNSTTGPTKTIGAANCWFDAQYL